MITRRGFLGLLAGAIAGAAVDPDKLPWRPGAKLISIPAPPPVPPIWRGIEVGDIITIDGRYAVNPRTRESMEYLQQFVICSAVDSADDDGAVLGLQPVVSPFVPPRELAQAAWKPGGVRRLSYDELRKTPVKQTRLDLLYGRNT